MASYQRVALFILFDSMESDLVQHLRSMSIVSDELLNETEKNKAFVRLQKRESQIFDPTDDFELVNGLDLGDKYQILMRNKHLLPTHLSDYFSKINNDIVSLIPVRNATMHGRPLTTTEYAIGFSVAEKFIKSPTIW